MVHLVKKRQAAAQFIFVTIVSAVVIVVCIKLSVSVLVALTLVDRSTYDVETYQPLPVAQLHVGHLSRQLLMLANCTPPAIEQFPSDMFTHSERRHGAFIVHVLIAAYMFLAIAIVCDDYFVPSCERLCEVLHLQEDVAGATFMAAGSSAPELATAIIGVFIAKNDIGLGAVVGSAVFNIMFVISVCALFAGMVVYLRWWPLFRDCLFYAISILALVLVIKDEQVCWYEAMSFLILYIIYLILMYFNRPLEAWVMHRFPGASISRKGSPLPESRNGFSALPSSEEAASDAELNQMNSSAAKINYDTELNKTNNNSAETVSLLSNTELSGEDVLGNRIMAALSTQVEHSLETDGENNASDEEEVTEFDIKEGEWLSSATSEPPWVWSPPEGCFRRTIWIISVPAIALLFITVPDCRRVRWKNWYALTFISAIVWIGLYAYIMVWMLTVVGHTWHIPDSVMSLTLIAAGSSVPDAIASLIVVRNGSGDMAVSNAVGSNVFDILLCLGLPWFLHTIIYRESVEVYSAGLTYSALTLLTTVVLLLLMTHINGWKLTKAYGAVLMVIYILFNILTCLYELNYFGYVHPPECPILY